MLKLSKPENHVGPRLSVFPQFASFFLLDSVCTLLGSTRHFSDFAALSALFWSPVQHLMASLGSVSAVAAGGFTKKAFSELFLRRL